MKSKKAKRPAGAVSTYVIKPSLGAAKSKNSRGSALVQSSFGLVASGNAGGWEVALDETIEGAQRWFAQIEGPGCYVYFRISHPRTVDEMVTFLKSHLCSDKCMERSTSARNNGDELELSRLDGCTVSLIWDADTNLRCFILISGKGEFRIRLCIERSDLQELTDALDQMRDELCQEGILT